MGLSVNTKYDQDQKEGDPEETKKNNKIRVGSIFAVQSGYLTGEEGDDD